jgi:hypothetical protein
MKMKRAFQELLVANPQDRNAEEKGLVLLWTLDRLRSQPAALELINDGAQLDVTTQSGRTPLILAARNADCSAVVKALIQNGVAIDLQDKEGWTALMQAAYNGSVESARLLLDAGASLELITGWNGHTPLLWAEWGASLGGNPGCIAVATLIKQEPERRRLAKIAMLESGTRAFREGLPYDLPMPRRLKLKKPGC